MLQFWSNWSAFDNQQNPHIAKIKESEEKALQQEEQIYVKRGREG